MKKFLSSQKIGIVGLSFALALAFTPFVASDTAYAAACPTSAAQLTSAISSRETDITLCANINGSVDISSHGTYNFSIKLNGKNLNNGNNTVIKVRQNSTLTISGSGVVTGTIDSSSSRLTITGGTYTSNPSRYVKDSNLAVYPEGNLYHVLPKASLDVSPATITTGVGEEDQTITATATGTTTPVSFTSKDTSIATVSDTGVVKGVSVGTTTITVSASVYDTVLSQDVSVSVFDIQAGTGDNESVAADTVKDIVFNEGLPDDMADASDKVKEAFGADYVATGENLKTAMADGAAISTNVNVKESTDADAIAKINKALEIINVTNVKYYDISVEMEADGDTIGALKKLDGKLTILLAEVENPAAGYERQYYVVAYHEGDNEAIILTEGTDYIIKNGKIYLLSDRFSTFAVAYKDTLIQKTTAKTTKTPNTGYTTTAQGVTSSLVSPALALGMLTTIGTFGAVKVAKRQR